MTETILELEGTWDELAKHAAELEGKRLRLTVLPAAESGGASSARSIEEEIAKIFSDVSREEWESTPDDLSDQLDHYIYGTPKR